VNTAKSESNIRLKLSFKPNSWTIKMADGVVVTATPAEESIAAFLQVSRT